MVSKSLGFTVVGAVTLATMGAFPGVLLSIVTGRFLSSTLYGVASIDAVTYVAIVAVVLPIVVLAGSLPAWRASRADPMVTLRYE